MKLADRSPGAVIALAAVVVYGQILIEIGMWMISETAAVAFALVSGAVLAVVVLKFLFSLLDEEEPGESAEQTAKAAAPAAAPARTRTPMRPAHV